MIETLIAYRGFIYASVKREFQTKYSHSLLGFLWAILNPLAMIIIYTVIFSQVMGAKLPGVEHGYAYSIYLCSGALTWGLFAEIVGRGQNIFLDNASIIKKINFPRIFLPIIVIINSIINFAIIFTLFLIFLMVSGFWPGWVLLAIFPLLCIQLLFAVGLGVTLGIFNVFFRDVGHFLGVFIQFWFWCTPVVYPADILPSKIKGLMDLNPMYPLINAYQRVFVNYQWPMWETLIYPLMGGIIMCVFGVHLYRRHVGEIVDEL